VTLTADEAIALVKDKLWPALRCERDRMSTIDDWYRWEHKKPSVPQRSTSEYRELADRSQAPWGTRVVTAVTDQLYVEGYRSSQDTDNAEPWSYWQANGWDARQIALHQAATAYGLAYGIVLPGKLGDVPMPLMRGLDPSQMIAMYDDPAWDDWPLYAMRARAKTTSAGTGWEFRLYDSNDVYTISADADASKLELTSTSTHGVGVCPVVRYVNKIDLRGRADGEVEPVIPLLGCIDQTRFDRLVVQRFASFVVRTVTGMSPPETLENETEEQWRTRVAKMLRVSDLLAADDPDTKFGSLPATPLDGFIAAHDADVRALAAVSQSPAHELLAQLANLSAESLAAAEASLTRKVEARKHTLGESHEQMLRLAAKIAGDEVAAGDYEAQVVWRDMESRSLAQAADALGKLSTMLGVPAELLWEKIPGFTQQDVERAKVIAQEAGGLSALLAALNGGAVPPEATPPAPPVA
jgi:hypothetical protein